ncbi:CaiB/BaiF CoA-transferase family protein [Mesorhizobium sp.]|uniref:CaiB/BaiF CoA transferase family protein n=1 Tax=Mesorhizobium sp. TaxID=1871066 RepID=UPI000FE33E35|nr:CaiB/BaiF CoA-transferase family protein [Mesorhizobium sp.]RWN48081.1 MAG: CoA transferase [Mesorhizobium sp.]RWN68517.1 MAG: CoA transferase [Mesorhizobium sp.]RWN71306.1 MAG: CoA transferase [Mesorhizobium sp.]RWN82307.1 MAG: CoA transferase [Mesorhizobium sp.]RWO06755.1 MAG: CoA transferase [Mesorhizobium sp.]
MTMPLEGLLVLDLSMNSPGPLASMMLSDFGAAVVHVVRPATGTFGQTYGGDIADDPYITSRFQPHDAVNRNKRSLALDLKTTKGRNIFLGLVRKADILLEEFRPGKLAALGLGYDDLKAINSRLIYCSITGYGQSGPMRNAAGHDINYLAMTGALDMIRGQDDQPVNPQNILSDNGGASMSAVIGVLLALVHRMKTGEGQYIDANCTDSVIYLMADLFSTALGGRHTSQTWRDTFLGRLPHYRAYRCQDGNWISVGALEAKFTKDFFGGLGRPELMELLDDRARWAELTTVLTDIFLTKPRDAWVETFNGTDACITPVLSLEEIAEHPQTRERAMIVHDFGIPQIGIAPKLSLTPGTIRSAPFCPGKNSQDILSELGISTVEYETLRREGVTE